MLRREGGRVSATNYRRLLVTVLGVVLPLALIGAAAFVLATNLNPRSPRITSNDDTSKVIRPWAR